MEASHPPRYRVLVVDDHLLIRQGLRALLQAGRRAEIVAEAGSIRQAMDCLSRTPCDYVLMDLALPDGDGISCMQQIGLLYPGLPVMLLTQHADPENVERALRLGARAFLPKSAGVEEIFDAFRAVSEGGVYVHPAVVGSWLGSRLPAAAPSTSITERERQVLGRVARGMTSLEIGQELHLAESTVKTHLRNLYQKLSVNNRSGLVFKALSEGLLSQTGA